MAGELLLYFRVEEGDPIPVTVSASATVGELQQEVAKASGNRRTVQLAHAGEELTDPSVPIADVGVSSQTVLHVLPRLHLIMTQVNASRETIGVKEVALPVGSTLDDLESWGKVQAPPLLYATFGGEESWHFWAQLDQDAAAGGPPRPPGLLQGPPAPFMPSIEGTKLKAGPLTEQGVKSETVVKWLKHTPGPTLTAPIPPTYGRPYLPGAEQPLRVAPPLDAQTCRRTALGEHSASACVMDEPQTVKLQTAISTAVNLAEREERGAASCSVLALHLMTHAAPGQLLDACLGAARASVAAGAQQRAAIAAQLGGPTSVSPSLPAGVVAIGGSKDDLASRLAELAVAEAPGLQHGAAVQRASLYVVALQWAAPEKAVAALAADPLLQKIAGVAYAATDVARCAEAIAGAAFAHRGRLMP
eukprot:TRINITY_DN14950_c0_g2_i2.p1 TRINITY_DN14950_c0_g2~~TRINITY_DN14950_c0_g2_i2.p1  ORF type:complete len:447 (+),score=86.77 TRINITY_DN14950_c0_g2_i2:89-1342(+)